MKFSSISPDSFPHIDPRHFICRILPLFCRPTPPLSSSPANSTPCNFRAFGAYIWVPLPPPFLSAGHHTYNIHPSSPPHLCYQMKVNSLQVNLLTPGHCLSHTSIRKMVYIHIECYFSHGSFGDCHRFQHIRTHYLLIIFSYTFLYKFQVW
jgi:hypothetical protein